jgi:phosphoribosylformylglycinamidine synthase
MADVANRFQTPVISGNVSFYNETEGVTVNPSPVVGVAGLMKINNVKTLEFKNSGDKIVVIGETRSDLGGSEYQKLMEGKIEGEPPMVYLDDEYSVTSTVLNLIRSDLEGHITAVHDCSTGGLGVALSEMALSREIGAQIDLSQIPSPEGLNDFEKLFSESHGRFIITVKEEAADEILGKIKSPVAIIGTVGGDSLILNQSTIIPLSYLKNAYHGVIEKFMA